MSGKTSFFAELKRRNVYKVGVMYAVAGWLLVQVVTQGFPIFEVSALVQRIIVLVIVAGFPVALVLSWIYELTPQGIVRTDEVAPDASVTQATGHKLNRAIIGTLSVAVHLQQAVHQHRHLQLPHRQRALQDRLRQADGGDRTRQRRLRHRSGKDHRQGNLIRPVLAVDHQSPDRRVP